MADSVANPVAQVDPAMQKRIAVIGAGWAGCAAAVRLTQRGHQVALFEASRTLGGRARRVELEGKPVDNGQHIMLGAYRETLAVMHSVGLDPANLLRRLPLQMRYANGKGMDFIAPKLPAPWHMLAALLRAKGLAWQDKLALARFSSLARWIDWRLNIDCSVNELLQRYDQTPRLIALMWRPLCIAALNTPPERASAQVFLNVLRDSLGANRAASDMLIPRTDLSALFPKAAADYVTSNGGALHFGATVQNLVQNGAGWQIAPDKMGSMGTFDAVIIATQPEHAARLLDGLANSTTHAITSSEALQTTRSQLASFSYEPITTCYLQYDPVLRLPLPFMALQDDAVRDHWGQFVFDRGQLDTQHAGLLAVVVSASEQAIALPRHTLAALIAKQLASVLQMDELAAPQWHGVISEKRATYSCRPDLQRPPNQTGLPNLLLAGDYTSSGNVWDDYPATIESAVRSAIICADLL